MAKTVSVALSYSISGDGVNESGTSPNLTMSNAAAAPRTSVTTTNGFTAIAPPSGFTTLYGVLVIPPAGSSIVKTWKGVTGDTGILQNNNGTPIFLPYAGGANLGVTATGSEILELIWV